MERETRSLRQTKSLFFMKVPFPSLSLNLNSSLDHESASGLISTMITMLYFKILNIGGKMQNCIGIDVSKKTLDVAWCKDDKNIHIKVSNNEAGFNEIIKLAPKGSHFIMEATGAYYLRLAYFLFSHKLDVSVVNPLTIKRFGQMKLRRAKTDKADAFLIAEFGVSQAPALWLAPDLKILEMQQLWALSDTLVKQKTALTNQLEAFSKSPSVCKMAVVSIKEVTALLDKDLRNIEKEMEMEILRSIPGIGEKSAKAMIIVSKGFKEFDNGRALCSFIGITPRIAQSGTSLNSRGKITKIGQGKMRSLLYMCALTAIKNNSGCKQMYERLVNR